MSQNKKSKAYVKKLKNGFAIKAISNDSCSENVLIITSDYLVKSNRDLNKEPSSVGCQTSGQVSSGNTPETLSRNSNNAINTVLSHLEPYLCELKPEMAGFHVFKNDRPSSPKIMTTSIIFVANTELARETGVTLDVPAKLVNVHKTVCSGDTIMNGEPVVKPVMIIVGKYVVNINISCCIPTEPPSITTGTQTSDVCAETELNDFYYYDTVTSDIPTITHVMSAELSQTNSPQNTQNMMSETDLLLESYSSLSTVEQQDSEEMSMKQTFESQTNAISCFEPIQYTYTTNSTTQTEYVGTNSLATSTTDLNERESSDEDMEDDYDSYQNLSTLVMNDSTPDVCHLENKSFESHDYCRDSDSFDTYASHYQDPMRMKNNVIHFPNDVPCSKNNIITIFENSLNSTSKTFSFDTLDNNNCRIKQSKYLNQVGKKDHLPMITKIIDIRLTQSLSRNLTGTKEFVTNTQCPETYLSASENVRIFPKETFSNSLKDLSGSSESSDQIKEVYNCNKYANKLKPYFYSFNYKSSLKEYKKYETRSKLIDKSFKQKPNVFISYTKQKIVYPKCSKSVSTLITYNMNNQTKSKLKNNYRKHYMYCRYTRKSVFINPTNELEMIKSKSNPYNLKNNKSSYESVDNLPNSSESENNSSIYFYTQDIPTKNTSCISLSTNSYNYKNKLPIDACPIQYTDKFRMNLEENLLDSDQLHKHDLENTRQTVPKLISEPQLVYELNRNVNYSNVSSSENLIQVMLSDQQSKDEINKENTNSKSINIDQIFEEQTTFGTQRSSVHIFPSNQEVQLASIDLSNNYKSVNQSPLKETDEWPPAGYQTDVSKIFNYSEGSVKPKPTLKPNLNNHLTFSCPVKGNFFLSRKKGEVVEKKRSKNKINSFVNYLFYNVRKHKNIINK